MWSDRIINHSKRGNPISLAMSEIGSWCRDLGRKTMRIFGRPNKKTVYNRWLGKHCEQTEQEIQPPIPTANPTAKPTATPTAKPSSRPTVAAGQRCLTSVVGNQGNSPSGYGCVSTELLIISMFYFNIHHNKVIQLLFCWYCTLLRMARR
jgi:hypothetical protein